MYFLAFEGLDGSGKSTLINALKSELEGRRQTPVITREPGGTPLGDEIRTLLLKTEGDAPVARAEALLYQASRAQHVETVIRPAMARGAWVLCDRFSASSRAFQGGGRAIADAEIEWLNTFSTRDLKPDLYILLDLSVKASAGRLTARGGMADRLEREAEAFHERVRATYLELAAADPSRWLILPANLTRIEILARVLKNLKERQWLA